MPEEVDYSGFIIMGVAFGAAIFYYLLYRLVRFGPKIMWLPGAKQRKKIKKAEERDQLLADYKSGGGGPGSSLIESALNGVVKLGEHIGNELEKQKQKENQIKRLASDPQALDALSEIELEHLRLTTESEVEAYEEAVKAHPDAKSLEFPGLTIDMRSRKLLLRMIESSNKRPRPSKKEQVPSREEKRAAFRARMADLRRNKEEDVAATDDPEMKKRIENKYDNEMMKLVDELEKYL